jgi:transposase
MIAETIKATQVPWGGTGTAVVPDPEVPAKATRRRFTPEYKRRILGEADACADLGALLRREGLYSSNITTWRKQRDHGVLKALSPKKRGRKETVRNPLVTENEKLRKENERLTKRIKQAELIIDFQKKVAQMLGIPLSTPEEGGGD